MSTSLKEQLQRLAVPQANAAVADARRKDSILFDRKEAAGKDRRTIYELGVSGLQELIAINPIFEQFQSTLFDEASISLERSVERSDVNKILDKNIRKFFHYLSPYFLLRPSQMCLEWLLRRFQVHTYNMSDLVALALPYHETNIFVRVLQVLRIPESNKDWAWLRPIQKPGVPMPKSAIINRAASTPGFLQFVCRTTLDAVRELGTNAQILQTQMNFYATVVVGALENTPYIQEWHISTILESLLHALNSKSLDLVCAGFIISGQLVARTQLTQKLCNALVARVASVTNERLRQAAVLLIIWIFDMQKTAAPTFSDETFRNYIGHNWLTPLLSSLANDNVDISPLCVPLMRAAVAAIQNGNGDAAICKTFLENLLNDVKFCTQNAQDLINCFLDSFVSPKQPEKSAAVVKNSLNDGDVIELNSDDDEDERMTDVSNDFQAWYSDYLNKLERKFPNAFDLAIKEALSSTREETSDRSKAIKMALGYRLKFLDGNATGVYENLYHHSAKIRLYAIKKLLANLGDYKAKSQNYQLLKECLADRIDDDSDLVVGQVLKLSTKDFIDILGCEKFVQSLIGILNKSQLGGTNENEWSSLTLSVIRHLTASEVLKQYDANIILLALMPKLFPNESTQSTMDAIEAILKSALVKKLKFLLELDLNASIPETNKKNSNNLAKFSAKAFRKQFMDVISTSSQMPKAIDLLESVQQQDQSANELFKHAIQFTYFLILITATLKETISTQDSLRIFETIRKYWTVFKIKIVDHNAWHRQECLPLQLVSDFLRTLTMHTKFTDAALMHWQHHTEKSLAAGDLHYFMSIFNILAEQAFTQEQPEEKLEWSKALKTIFDVVFHTAQAKMEFLTNFYLYSNYKPIECVDDYGVLRVRSFKLMNSLLQNKENKIEISVAHLAKIIIALSDKSETIRTEALSTLSIIDKHIKLADYLKTFIELILERHNEIGMDYNQFPLILYTILKSPQKRQQQVMATKLLNELMQLLTSMDHSDAIFTAETLKMLKHVNDEALLGDLLPLASKALDKVRVDNAVKLLDEPYDHIFTLIVERFEAQTIENVLIDKPESWKLFEKIFQSYDVFVALEGNLQPVPCVLLQVLDEQMYEHMPAKYKLNLLKLIIQCIAAAGNDTVFLSANKLLKKCTLECQPLVAVLQHMFKDTHKSTPKKRKSLSDGIGKRISTSATQLDTTCTAWREGVALLELLENKKKLIGTEELVPVLFELLKACLQLEEQTAVEYTKQLTLSSLLHCCQKAKADGVDLAKTLPKTTFRIDQIVQCMRATPNPQTHNNALILLCHCAALFPQQVLHNIVDIFTFMGSSVVRHDDAFSFHIIDNIIESIIPILVRQSSDQSAANNAEAVNKLVVPVLKVFSDIMLDVPEHRIMPLYTKLMQTLGAEQYLWSFICVVIEAQALADDKQKKPAVAPNLAGPAADKSVKRRLDIIYELTKFFEPPIVLHTCTQLIDYMKNLPLNKDNASATMPSSNSKKFDISSTTVDVTEVTLFDVKCRTARQFRHYKYTIMQFLAVVTRSPELVQKISVLNAEQLVEMRPYYHNMIINTLSYVPILVTALEDSSGDEAVTQAKFCKVLLHHLHDVLDNAISLLSPDVFLIVINGLMQHKLMIIRRKVIEVLIGKLQQRDGGYFDACDEQNVHNLLKPLNAIVLSILSKDESALGALTSNAAGNEVSLIQQTALIAIKLLSKMLALNHIEEFQTLLNTLTTIIKQRRNIPKIVLATVLLSLVEVASNLKAHSLSHLSKYMPQLIEVLRDQAEQLRQQPPDNVTLALISGIQKLFDTLPLFLGPYMVDVITALSLVSTRITAQNIEKDQRAANILNKITTIWTKISNDIPLRILIPSCEKAYTQLMSTKSYPDIGVLMRLLPQSISKASSTDLISVHLELSEFFLHALELRVQLKDSQYERQNIAATEMLIIEAFVAWVLKLSESSFRPLYSKVYKWALKEMAVREAQVTYFLLMNKMAEALKSLFVLFAGDFIEDSAQLLTACNITSTTITELQENDEYLNTELVRAILSTLYNVFLHDNKGSLNTHFNTLLQPIVEQLENRLILENDALQEILTACIAQLAVAVTSDVHWKLLYQVLLKTRTNVPEVRILSFNCCVEIARKLGDDFTSLLPETIPFIAELFEDENPRVEKNTRKSVQELESILGESLQKYL